jgi:ketosteroid isomerase-like protein
MSEKNVDLVRSLYAAWGRGDFSSAEWAHPEIAFVIVDGPEPFESTGVTAMASRWREWLGAWEDYSIEVDEFRELDDERVLVLNRYRGRGRASGLELGHMQVQAATLLHVRGGKVTKFVGYNDRANALADLGLASEGGSPGS